MVYNQLLIKHNEYTNFFAGHGFDAVNSKNPDPSGAPVKLRLNPADGSDIVPGQTVSVSLEAQEDNPENSGFKGFIIQARDEKDTQVGSFSIEGDLVSHMTCGKGNLFFCFTVSAHLQPHS